MALHGVKAVIKKYGLDGGKKIWAGWWQGISGVSEHAEYPDSCHTRIKPSNSQHGRLKSEFPCTSCTFMSELTAGWLLWE